MSLKIKYDMISILKKVERSKMIWSNNRDAVEVERLVFCKNAKWDKLVHRLL